MKILEEKILSEGIAVNEDILFIDAIDEVIEEEELQYTIQEGLQYEIDLLEEEWNN